MRPSRSASRGMSRDSTESAQRSPSGFTGVDDPYEAPLRRKWSALPIGRRSQNPWIKSWSTWKAVSDAIDRRAFLKTSAAPLAQAALAQSLEPNPPPCIPTFLIIMADQHRAGLTRAQRLPHRQHALARPPGGERRRVRPGLHHRTAVRARAHQPAHRTLAARSSRPAEQRAEIRRFRERSFSGLSRPAVTRPRLTGKNHCHLTPDARGLLAALQPSRRLDADARAARNTCEFERWMQHLNHGTSQEPDAVSRWRRSSPIASSPTPSSSSIAQAGSRSRCG